VKILSNLFYICDVGCGRDAFGLHTIGGPAAPPLTVVVVGSLESLVRSDRLLAESGNYRGAAGI
jgi:hypothetical protein